MTALPATGIWAVSFAFILLYEGVTIGTAQRGDTLSEHVWELLRTPAKWALAPALTWTALHWLVPTEPNDGAMNDLAYIALGLGFALWQAVHRR